MLLFLKLKYTHYLCRKKNYTLNILLLKAAEKVNKLIKMKTNLKHKDNVIAFILKADFIFSTRF